MHAPTLALARQVAGPGHPCGDPEQAAGLGARARVPGRDAGRAVGRRNVLQRGAPPWGATVRLHARQPRPVHRRGRAADCSCVRRTAWANRAAATGWACEGAPWGRAASRACRHGVRRRTALPAAVIVVQPSFIMHAPPCGQGSNLPCARPWPAWERTGAGPRPVLSAARATADRGCAGC